MEPSSSCSPLTIQQHETEVILSCGEQSRVTVRSRSGENAERVANTMNDIWQQSHVMSALCSHKADLDMNLSLSRPVLSDTLSMN